MIIKSDDIAEASADILGRASLAKEIAKGIKAYIKRQKNGITLSITGEWGSGKSTLLQYLLSEFDENEDNLKIICFNPWMFYKNESIRQAFLIELALALKDFETSRTQVAKKIKDLVKAFEWIKNVSAVGGSIQQGVQQTVDFFSGSDSVMKIKTEVEKLLLKSKKKIIVVIDDIDRLMPEQIMEVFQTVSLVTDFSNIIYILAFDKKIVVEAIDHFFKAKGEDYLEKIIQIDYEIPKILDEKLNSIFVFNIKQIETLIKIKFDEYAINSLWDYHGLKHYFKNIRDFKRFFNSISFRLPTICEEVNVTDFLVVEAIRIFDYNAYEKVYNFYTSCLRRRNLSNKILTEEFKNFASPTSDLLIAIFPESSLASLRKDSKLKRLHDPAYFERYFTLLKTNSDISDKDLREIIQRPNIRKGLLKETASYDRIGNLIERLNERELIKYYPKYDYDLVSDLISFFNENSEIFENRFDKVSDMLINLICIHPKKNDLIKQFFSDFGAAKSPINIVHIYFFHYMRLFLQEGGHFRSDFPEFENYYKTHYQYIEDIFIDDFKGFLGETLYKSFTKSSPFIKYLYQINFAQLFPDSYPEYFKTLIKDVDYSLYLAQQCIWLQGPDYKFVGYNPIRIEDVYLGGLFVNLYEVISTINDEKLTEVQKIVKRHFLALDITKYPEIKYPQ